MPRIVRLLAAAAAAASLTLALAAPAQAGRNMLSILQDDRVLTRQGEARMNRALDEMKLLGVDVIRTVVNWERVAPAARSRDVPGVDLTNPAHYPVQEWDAFDQLVRAATARGMRILMNPAGAMPDWASGCAVNTYRVCLPNVELYGRFVTAVARRYSGSYLDETDGQPLPRVDLWSLWNEPNLNSWIEPQTIGSGKKRRRVAAKIYRGLAYAGIDALRANGHAGATILLGETAPLGAPPKRTSPVQFYRDLFCLDSRGRTLRGRPAKQLGCSSLRRFDVQGLAHHPYVKGAGPPIPARVLEGSATVGTMDPLKRVMRQAAARKLIRKRLPIWVTEFGISTNPPDRKYGVKLSTAAAYLNQVDRYLWLDRDVVSTHQFEYEDDTALLTLTFQTGLRFGDGTPKPGLQAYRLPVYVTRAGSRDVNVWGWVRPAAKGAQTVAVQNRASGVDDFRTVRTARTDRYGILNVRTRARKGTWRLAWTAPDGEVVTSRVAKVDRFNRPPQPGASPPGPGGTPAPGGTPTNPDPTNPGPTNPTNPTDPTNPTNPTNPTDPSPQPTPTWSLGVSFVREANVYPSATLAGKSASGRVTLTPPGRNCAGSCSEPYAEGTVVQLTAAPDPGSAFRGWDGACTGTAPTCTVTMSSARSVTARFQYVDPF